MPDKDYRLALLRCFWKTVSEAGMSEEHARRYVQGKYKIRISYLDISQLEAATLELIKIHDLKLSMPGEYYARRKDAYSNRKSSHGIPAKERIEFMTREQEAKINAFAGVLNLSYNGYKSILDRVSQGYSGPLTISIAQKLIEALKAIHHRRETETTERYVEPPVKKNAVDVSLHFRIAQAGYLSKRNDSSSSRGISSPV